MAEDVESKAAVRGPVAMHKRKSSASGGEVASEATSGGGGGGGGIMGAAPAAADDTLATPAHAHTAAFGVGVLHGASQFTPSSLLSCVSPSSDVRLNELSLSLSGRPRKGSIPTHAVCQSLEVSWSALHCERVVH